MPFKPGQSGNPGGRPPIAPEVKALRKLGHEELKDLGELVLLGDMQKIIEIADTTSGTPALHTLMCKALKTAYEAGHWPTVEMILTRLLGKVPDVVVHRTFKPNIIVRPSGEIVEIGIEEIAEEA